MKRKEQVRRRGKIRKLKASAGRTRRPPELAQDLTRFYRPIKKPVTLRLDADIIAWFQRQGRGYQTRINRALRKLIVEAEK